MRRSGLSKAPLILLLVIATAAGGGTLYYFRQQNSANQAVLRVSGNIEVIQAQISFKIPGKVIARLVDEGEPVRKSQVVARLEDRDLIHNVALRQGELEAAQAALAELKAGSRPQEIAQAKAAVDQANADVERQKVEYDRLFKLKALGRATDEEFSIARAAYDSAKAATTQAEQHYSLVKEGPRQEDIDQAAARLDQAQASLGLARTQVEYATVVSPLNGVVLSKNIEPGEYVSPGTPVVTAADLQDIWLRAYVNETDLGRIKLGQPVRVTTDTWPGKVYAGWVSFISSEAEFTPKVVQTEKERVKLVYRVKITLDNSSLELKPGMPADGEIRLDQIVPTTRPNHPVTAPQ